MNTYIFIISWVFVLSLLVERDAYTHREDAREEDEKECVCKWNIIIDQPQFYQSPPDLMCGQISRLVYQIFVTKVLFNSFNCDHYFCENYTYILQVLCPNLWSTGICNFVYILWYLNSRYCGQNCKNAFTIDGILYVKFLCLKYTTKQNCNDSFSTAFRWNFIGENLYIKCKLI